MKQTAEFLGAGGQLAEADTTDGGRVMRQDRQGELHPRAGRAFVAQVSCPPAQPAGDHTLDHWPTVAGRVGELHVARRAGAMQVRGGQRHGDDVRRGCRCERLPRRRNTNREDTASMQLLAQRGVVHRQITGQGMDDGCRARRDLATRGLGLVEQRYHAANVTGIADRQSRGKDEARCGLTQNSGLAPKLGEAMKHPPAKLEVFGT